MSLKIIVLAKQVPDTRNVGPDAMTPEGTVNRAALPAVFNPEDLNALEQALRLKDANPGSTITMLTMGLPKAAEVLKEGSLRNPRVMKVLGHHQDDGDDSRSVSYAVQLEVDDTAALHRWYQKQGVALNKELLLVLRKRVLGFPTMMEVVEQ